MKSDSTTISPDPSVYDDDTDIHFSIEVIAELTGIDPQTILYYQAQGFIRPATREVGDDKLFDSECLRQLRRIEHLRATCEVNDVGLRLILDLLHETECLREERRQLRH